MTTTPIDQPEHPLGLDPRDSPGWKEPNVPNKIPDDKLPPGHKYSEGKNRLGLLPGFGALMTVGLVASFGAKKYKDHNWRGATTNQDYIDALLRHVMNWVNGEDNDPESGLHHLAHAAWNCLALLQLKMDGKCADARYGVKKVYAKCTKCGATQYSDGSVFIPMGHAVPLSTQTDFHEHVWKCPENP